jgi:hypothetical protein
MRISQQTLQLRVHPYPDEPLHGYVARLARLHGKPSIPQFLKDYARGRIAAAQVLHGETQAEIARLVDLPEDAFAASTFARVSLGKYSLNGEQNSARDWSYRVLRACPACLREDQQNLPGRPDFRAHVRFWWNIDAMRACPFHATALLGDPAAPNGVLDWRALDLRRAAENCDLTDAAAIPAEEDEVSLSRFIAAKLGLLPRTDEPPIVFDMPLDWALEACERIGAMALAGHAAPTPAAQDPTFDAHLARRVGYRILRGGHHALRRVLDRQVEKLHASATLPTPAQAYGRLYAWVIDRIGDPRIEELQEAVCSHGFEHLRVSERQQLFRGETGNRRRFSIRQAAVLLHASEKKLRRIVSGLDNIPRLARQKYGARDEFIDPTTLKNIEIALLDACSERQAADILGVDLPLMRQLQPTKIFGPFVEDPSGVLYLEQVVRDQMARLIGDAPAIAFAGPDEILLTKTPLLHQAMHVARVVSLLRRGRLKPIGLLNRRRDLSGVVLRVEDLLKVFGLRRAQPERFAKYVGFAKLAVRLRCAVVDAKALVKNNAIQPEMHNRLERGRRVPIFDADHIDAFLRDAVSINELDRRLPIHRSRILSAIRKHALAGAEPGAGAPVFFRRQQALSTLGLSCARE